MTLDFAFSDPWLTEKTVAPLDPVLFFVLLTVSPTFQEITHATEAERWLRTARANILQMTGVKTDPSTPLLPGHPAWEQAWNLLGVNVALENDAGQTAWIASNPSLPTVKVRLSRDEVAVWATATPEGLGLMGEARITN